MLPSPSVARSMASAVSLKNGGQQNVVLVFPHTGLHLYYFHASYQHLKHRFRRSVSETGLLYDVKRSAA